MKLYALLIGINDYPDNPLHQCVGDVEKVNTYLQTLAKEFETIQIQTLLNTEATRENVITQIKQHLGKAKNKDTALLYFSGHGCQEQTAGLFPDEHDGLMECLVCYGEAPITTDHLLANKEVRYLLHQLPADPHLVTVVDACHSGDIVRSYQASDKDHEMVKRIAGTFEARAYKNFAFAEDESIIQQVDGVQQIYIPFKNHVHISACLSSESSWEDWKGGVFTRYLLELLDATQGNLSYLDIARWAKISLKDITRKKQTPTISVQGAGPLNAQSSWLNLNPDGVSFPNGFVTNNKKKGWIYSRGSLLGVKEGMQVCVDVDGEEISLEIKTVDINDSKINIPLDQIDKFNYDESSSYPAYTKTSTYSELSLSLNPIDDEPEALKDIEQIINDYPNVRIVEREAADFGINIYNGMAYVSLPDQEFQPLAQQVNLKKGELQTALTSQIRSLIKWQHFFTLENPGKDFETCPIQVTLKESDEAWTDVSNGTFRMNPMPERGQAGTLMQKVSIQIKNISTQRLYVGVLTLNSDLSITSKPFDGKVIELEPNAAKTFYDHKADKVFTSLDHYKEVYNWKEEWFYYKFIYNNYEDFSASLNDQDFLQPAAEAPLTVQSLRRTLAETARGEGGEMEEVVKRWGTCVTRLELANTTYNAISGDLKDSWDEYSSSILLSPFIKELYFEEFFNGKNFELKLKQNKDQTAEEATRATDSWIVKQLNGLYNRARRRKFRRQKHQAGPVVVAEGDSWFLFPKPGVRDTIDYIMKEFRVLSLADAGDEIADYLANNELLEAVTREQPDFVLISGGGNDILGSAIKDILLSGITNGQRATDFIDSAMFQSKMKFLKEGYTLFFQEIKDRNPSTIIFVHGYDYIRSSPDAKTVKNGWANKYMIEAGIVDAKDRKKIISHLVDTFNSILEEFTVKFSHVRYVNNRGTVQKDEWMDEIHPNNIGYQKVADNFLSKMNMS